MALDDWYELVDEQFVIGLTDPKLNVYHVERDSALISAQEINQAYIDFILPALTGVQHNTIVHRRLITQNLGDPLDFQEAALGDIPGLASASGEIYHWATAPRVQFLRERTDMKHGWKRVIGAAEGHINGRLLVPAYQTDLQTYADAVIAPWETAANPGVTVCTFGIIARICAETDAAGVCIKYRLPENDAELEFYKPTQALALFTVGTQTSRKDL